MTTLVILFLMTGSVILPIKALVMNLLTLSAAFGALVLIFQDGNLEGLLDFEGQPAALEATQPVLLFAVAFGLATDYGVFLISRIKEARDDGHGRPRGRRVRPRAHRADRHRRGAPVLRGGRIVRDVRRAVHQAGRAGTRCAVAIDASIVSALLVPSLMALLGRWNWWAPRPLRWLHSRVGLSEGGPHPVAA